MRIFYIFKREPNNDVCLLMSCLCIFKEQNDKERKEFYKETWKDWKNKQKGKRYVVWIGKQIDVRKGETPGK